MQRPAVDYVRAAADAAVAIHTADVPGDILVFLASRAEIERCIELVAEAARGMRYATLRLLPLPMHAGLPPSQQSEVLEPTPRGVRRVIVATNVAASGVTIEGVVYVVDSLFAKQAAYNPLNNLESVLVATVSKSTAQLRAIRAGRDRPGHCFRLCTEGAFAELEEEEVPEVQRAPLGAAVLALKATGVDNVMAFPWLDAPPAEAAVRALEQLYALGAVNEDAKLTHNVGSRMAELPLQPPMAAALLRAAEEGCAADAATVAAFSEVSSVWAGPMRSKARREAQLRFAVAEGDMVTWLNIWRGWEEHRRSPKWARRNMLNQKALHRVASIRAQLLVALQRMGAPAAATKNEIQPVIKALLASHALTAAQFERTEYDRLKANDSGTHIYRLLLHTAGEPPRLAIDESSILNNTKPEFVIFGSCHQAESGLWRMQDVLATDALALQEAAPHVFQWGHQHGVFRHAPVEDEQQQEMQQNNG